LCQVYTRGTSTWSALRIYQRNGYDGVIIPDHTPQMECAASWHAGMAYALGWMRAALQLIEEEPRA
jgi:mannonate dehydratase